MKSFITAGSLASGIALAAATLATQAHATIVEFQTSQGSFQVNLFDQQTPTTVANFLGYVERGDYQSSYIHRSVEDFIIQGGAYTFDEQAEVIETQAPIINEPVYSNVAGTIAMAKRGGYVNSATSQWFFNISDNSANLDLQNGGFTVFGQVIGEGMTVVKAINALQTCGEIPMVDYSTEQCSQGDDAVRANLVMINDIIVIDNDPNSAIDLTPVENTLIDEVEPDSDSDSGAAWWFAPLALLVALRRRTKR
ncbi:peptidylprolyl isomerase [Pseudoalteromonas sp. BDTF-M6]|uniref:peptidylprolyl isomerase n=1 Tax=Pseudoalteromonas sp. BDTF-M6 TaxID=2796132 RepID=UPI001BB0AAA0|nr:peptidylprolyl isomerase [Pseudoalteromonas sp. BDTF-M6]MBS3797756.1 peptidylprolyl isomerase [Pseudoalteromonas sp. BDTF-M6]